VNEKMRQLSLTRTSFLAVVVAASLTLAPRAAWAQPNDTVAEDAKSHFNAAVGLFREGDYRAALVEFRRAYDLSHNYRTLYNIAQAEYELQDYAAALRSFEKYLIEGGADIEPERRVAVKAEMKRLSARVAKLDIKSNVAGADVLVDDVVVGRTPLSEPLVVSAGRRKITIQKADMSPASRAVDVAGGDTQTVVLDLAPPKPVLPKNAVVEPPREPPPSRTALWLSLAATGALTGGAVVTGLLAVGAHDDAEAKLSARGVTAREVESAHSKTTNLALATDILGGAAIAMGIVTIVIAASGKNAGDETRASASISAGPGGAILRGRF
jgi:hypothetical protein